MSWIALAVMAQPDFRDAMSRTMIRLRDRIAPHVVAIQVERTADPEGTGRRGGHEEHQDYYSRPKGPCSGTIFDDGWVVTSAFNVSGTIRTITVLTPQGAAIAATVQGYDKEGDIALLKCEGLKAPPGLERSDLADVQTGDLAIVVGRAPDPESPTINFGIVSALHRFGGTHLQTDAELNYGNVGGPLVNLRGRLLGIACQIKPNAHWGQSGGVGFAYRTDRLDELVERLKKGEKIEKTKRPARAVLGITTREGATDGVLVEEVQRGSAAAKAGLRPGDVIVEFAGKPVRSADELAKAVEAKKPGDKVKIKYKRKTGEHETEATLDEDRFD